MAAAPATVVAGPGLAGLAAVGLEAAVAAAPATVVAGPELAGLAAVGLEAAVAAAPAAVEPAVAVAAGLAAVVLGAAKIH